MRLLGLETATDACSAALLMDGELEEECALAPRQHSRILLPMVARLLAGRSLGELGLDAVVYGAGPGSFTGLRIAAAAAQGLAFSGAVPGRAVSTLAAQAVAARRLGAAHGAAVLSLIDARVGEVYWSLEAPATGSAPRLGAAVHRPEALPVDRILTAAGDAPLIAVGSGFEGLPGALLDRLAEAPVALVPQARDLLELAVAGAAGPPQPAEAIAPVYVRDTVRWKKLPEQGRRSS